MSSAQHPSAFAGHRVGTQPYRKITLALFLAGIATFALLYAPQPLLPALSRHFQVSAGDAALTVSATTAGLAIALLLVGPASEVWGRTRLMKLSLLCSAAVGIAAGLAPSWGTLLGLRVVLGITLAGLPAVAMAYLAEEIHPMVQARVAGLYIGGTAFGGMSGRLICGFAAQWWGWRTALIVIGALALLCALAVTITLPPSQGFTPAPASWGHLWRATFEMVRDPALLLLFAIGASCMGAFIGIFNAMGYRLEAPPYLLDLGPAGLIFLVYLLGSWSSAFAGRQVARFGQRKVVPWSAVIMGVGIAVTLADPLWAVLLGLAVVTIGFFGVHGVASGWVAARASAGKVAIAQASAAYLVCYYLGSSVFGLLAANAWSWARWPGVTALTGGLVGVVFLAALVLTQVPRLPDRRSTREEDS